MDSEAEKNQQQGKKYRDIIGELQERQMQSYLAGDILKYNMNFESLINAQQVSTTWREAIVASKLWKKLYKNQIEINQVWNKTSHLPWAQELFASIETGDEATDHETYEKNCQVINNAIQTVEENWKTGNIQWREVDINPNTASPNEESPLENLKFDEQHIVHYNKSKQSFEVFDRWTHKLKMTIPFPVIDQHNQMYNLHFDFRGHLLAAGYQDIEIGHLWDLNSGELLLTFNPFADFCTLLGDASDYTLQHVGFKKLCNLTFSPQGNRLLSVVRDLNANLQTVYKLSVGKIVNSREIVTDAAEQTIIGADSSDMFCHKTSHRYPIVFFDESFIVLCLPDDIQIQIRSASYSLELLRSIQCRAHDPRLDYSNGILFTRSSHCGFKIYNVATGSCVVDGRCIEQLTDATNQRAFLNNSDFRLVLGGKYLVSLSKENGMMRLRLWNLEQAMSSESQRSLQLLWLKKSTSMAEKETKGMTTEEAMKHVLVTYKIMAIDEYQISVFNMCRGSGQIYAIFDCDFLVGIAGLDEKRKLLSDICKP